MIECPVGRERDKAGVEKKKKARGKHYFFALRKGSMCGLPLLLLLLEEEIHWERVKD